MTVEPKQNKKTIVNPDIDVFAVASMVSRFAYDSDNSSTVWVRQQGTPNLSKPYNLIVKKPPLCF